MFYHVFFLTWSSKSTFFSSRFGAFSMIGEATKLFVLLGATNKSDRQLRVGCNHSLQRLSGQHSLGLLLASSGRRN